jgi:hypothetical protein
MDPIADQISRLSEKVGRLVKDFRALQRENERLRQELERKTDMVAGLEERCAELERQGEILRASPGIADGMEPAQLERLIEQYIRDIDKCIEKLGE